MTDKEIVAQRIKILREKLGVSQQEIADKIGVSRATYSDMERAKRDITASEIKSLADVFDISTDALLDEGWTQVKRGAVPAEEVIFNEQKLKNTLLYILEACGGKPNLGETVLYKLLYFIDFDMYERCGKSVTGLSYVHQKYGPVPLQAQYNAVIEKMQTTQEIKIFTQEYFGKTQKRYVALKEHGRGVLNEEEKDVIDSVLNHLSDMSATEIEKYVHLDVPWRVTKEREAIPYTLVFDREPPFAKRDYMEDFQNAAAQDVLKDLGDMPEDEAAYYSNPANFKKYA